MGMAVVDVTMYAVEGQAYRSKPPKSAMIAGRTVATMVFPNAARKSAAIVPPSTRRRCPWLMLSPVMVRYRVSDGGEP